MEKGITINKAMAGYTQICYNGIEIARHNLSATVSGTREAFDIPEEVSYLDWFAENYASEIDKIEQAEN